MKETKYEKVISVDWDGFYMPRIIFKSIFGIILYPIFLLLIGFVHFMSTPLLLYYYFKKRRVYWRKLR